MTTLRNEVLPATVGTVPGAEYAVTGGTAESHDFTAMMKRSAPMVFGFVLLFAFLLLLVAFRSIVVALKAIVLNLLSVAAAYGVLVAVFQWGWGENILDFNPTGGIASWLPMFLFVILFGLSMDYHVFILSRVREAYDRGLTTRDAVEHGIRSTAGVVTGAAVVMVARVQRLRAPAHPRHEGDGDRPRGRHPDRRDHRPRGAAARLDDPAGRPQLVPAQLARVAPPSRARAGDRRRRFPRAPRPSPPRRPRPRHGGGGASACLRHEAPAERTGAGGGRPARGVGVRRGRRWGRRGAIGVRNGARRARAGLVGCA